MVPLLTYRNGWCRVHAMTSMWANQWTGKADWRERFLLKFDQPDEGCWLWKASRDSKGYGQFLTDQGLRRAHRVSYELFRGPIPEGKQLDHLCRVRHCVRPDHLEIVTARENVRRGESPAARQAAQTHCIHGHAFDDENTYIDGLGKRHCRACRRELDSRRTWASRGLMDKRNKVHGGGGRI
jgi:hypothetical protein